MNAKELYFKTREEWRAWLEKNHSKQREIWVIYYKKHTKKPSITHEEGVEEAICFGWIDSRVNSIDDERYKQKYTPRNPKSPWSLINKKAAEKMIRLGKMAPAGKEKIEAAKKSGEWEKAYTSRQKQEIPEDLKRKLAENKEAMQNFKNFSNSCKAQYIGWIENAKRKETREKRVKEVAKRSAKNIKAGIPAKQNN